MYTSPDEARSDLFLAGAVYVLGPLVVSLLLRVIPLTAVPVLGTVLIVVVPFVLTGLVPLLLIRYRKEPWSAYGLGAGPNATLGFGVLLAVPIVVASILAGAAVVLGTDATLSLPAVVPVLAVGPGTVVLLLARVADWLGLALLAVFTTVKARDAFRADHLTVRDGMWDVGRWFALGSLIATTLLVLALLLNAPPQALLADARLYLMPLGVGAAAMLAYRSLPGSTNTTRATLLAPAVLLALGPFLISFQAILFLEGLWQAALLGVIGLIIAVLQEARGSGLGAFGLALAIALLAGGLP